MWVGCCIFWGTLGLMYDNLVPLVDHWWGYVWSIPRDANLFELTSYQMSVILTDRTKDYRPGTEWATNQDIRLSPESIANVCSPYSFCSISVSNRCPSRISTSSTKTDPRGLGSWIWGLLTRSGKWREILVLATNRAEIVFLCAASRL